MSINATPFNPTFKLVGNLQEDQVLVYNSSEGAFVNASGAAGAGTGGIDTVTHTGTGQEYGSITGSSLVLKTILAGNNVTVTDNGTSLVISADFTETLQSGTNLGTGSSLLAGIDPDSGLFSFKSIAAGSGLNVSDDGSTITLSASIDPSLYLTKSSNLSDLADAPTARTNLGAISQADGDARYLRLDAHNIPSVDNSFDLGSSNFRFNDIHAETLHGTALLADNLTIQGSNEGDVLTWNGSTWVAAEPAAGSGSSSSTPQTLVLNGQQLSISGGNTITLPSYNDVDNFVKTDGHSIPTQNAMWDIGSAEMRFNDVYGETFQGTAVLADNLTITGTQGQVLTYNGSSWEAGPVTLQTLSWDGNVLSISDGNSVSLNLGDYATKTYVDTEIAGIVHPNADWNTLENKPTIPSDVSELTDDTGLLTHVTPFSGDYADLTNKPTIPGDVSELTDTTGLLTHVTPFSGDYADLTNKPALFDGDYNNLTNKPALFDGQYSSLTGVPTIPADLSNLTDTTGLLKDEQTLSLVGTSLAISNGNAVDLSGFVNTDEQTLSLVGTTLAISNGNAVDLSPLQTTVDLTPYATQDYVDNALGALSDNDNQVLSFSGTTLSISNGNAVDLASLVDTPDLAGYATEDYVDAALAALTDQDEQTLALDGATLSITNGNSVDLTQAFAETAQTLSIADNILSISDGNSVTLPVYNDVDNYIKLDGHSAPTVDNVYDIGSAELRFNDIYGERFHGTAILADNLTITGDAGDVLTYRNGEWAAEPAPTGKQTLTLQDNLLTISDGNSVDLTGYVNEETTPWANITGTPTTLSGYGITDAIPTDISQLTDANGIIQAANTDNQRLTLNGEILQISGGNFVDLSNISVSWDNITDTPNTLAGLGITDEVPTDISDLTDSSGLLASTFSGSYNDLTDKPTIPTTITDLGITDGTSGQVLTTDGNGNYTFTAIPSEITTLSDIPNVSANEPTAGQVLKWDGTEWAPASDLTGADGSGISLTDISVTQEPASGTGTLTFNNITGVFTYTPPALTAQTLSLSSPILSISGGNSVDLSTIIPSDISEFTDTGNLLGQGGATTIGQLTDVNTTGVGHVPTDGQALVWSQSMNHWMPGDLPTVPSDISELTDVGGLLNSGTSYGDTDVSSYLNGGWNFHLVPDTDSAYDLGSATRKVRHLYLSDGSVYFGTNFNTLNTDGTNLLYNGEIVRVGDVDTDVDAHLNTSTAASGQVLTWNGSSYSWTTQSGGGTSFSGSYNDLTDKPTIATDISQLTDTTGIIQAANTDNQTLTLVGNSLQISGGNSVDLSSIAGASAWDDITGKPTTLSGFGITDAFSGSYDDLTNKPTLFDGAYSSLTGTPTVPSALGDLVNVSSSSPSTGQVLKWNGFEWAPGTDLTASSGSGITLQDLSVTNSTPTGFVSSLSYNNATGVFTFTPAAGGSSSFGLAGNTGSHTFDSTSETLTFLGTTGQINAEVAANFISLSLDQNINSIQSIAFEGSTQNSFETTISAANPSADRSIVFPNASGTVALTSDITAAQLQTIDDLSDVTVTTTQDGQFLVYNNVSGDWENKAVVLSDLSNVSNASPSTGQVLKWNGAEWAPSTDVTSSGGSGITLADLSVSNSGTPSGNGSLQYSSQTGVFTFTPADVTSGSRQSISVTTAAANGGGGLTYNSGTGTFTFTPADMTAASATAGGASTQIQFNNNGAFAGDSGFTFDSTGGKTVTIGNGGGKIKTNYWVGADNVVQPMVIQSDNGSGSKATHVAFTNSGGAPTTTFSGTVNFTGNTLQGIELTDLTGISDGSAGQVLTTDGNGGFTFTTVGGSSFSGNYNDLTNKPTIPSDVNQLTDASGLLTHNVYTQGTGIQINSNVVSLNATLGQLSNVSASGPAAGQVLGWTGSQWAPTTPSSGANLSTSSVGELNDVNISGIQTGQFLEWNGTSFVPASGGTVDLSTEAIGDLGDVSNATPNNGDVLTWNGTQNNWEPQAAPSGGGGTGSSTEYFKLNYATSGALSSISNTTSGVSATILDVNTGEVEITFSGYSFPPSNVLIYGYSRLTNEYVIMPLNKDITTRKLAAGGSAGSPIAFGTLGSLGLTLTLREADTGANRSFGTDTHAWIVISMI